MHSLLIPVDGSESSLKALRHVITMVHDGYSAHIHLLHVMPLVYPMDELQPPDYDLIEKAQKKQGRKILDGAGKLLKDAGLEYSEHMQEGLVPEAIVEYAHIHKCDAIIMGTRGMNAFSNWILGSTANRVVHASAVPVTLVK